jgi:hypothetical protein
MTTYQPGQRITLVHTTDPYTELRPGDTGTVRRHDQHLNTVYIDWDSGSRLSMCLDAGDSIHPLPPATTDSLDAVIRAQAWAATLARLAALGTEAGRGVAEWWAQDTIGGRATGDTRATARRILSGIDDGDPAVLDTLPTFTPPPVWADGRDTAQVRYTEAAHEATQGQAPRWQDLTDQQRTETIDASRDAFDTAVRERVTELCHLAASPTGRDVSHLHPDKVRIGSVGVFSGDWGWSVDADGTDRIRVGFVGVLIDTWNGWAVFSCTRTVAEAIVADQQQHRTQLRESYRARGLTGEDLDRRVDAEITDLHFDGQDIIADQRVMYEDPEAIERIEPDGEGRYVVMGWNWCWEATDPYACDRIVGELPEPGQEQQWVRLPHTGLRVPHDRLKVTDLQQIPTHNWPAYTATLTLDGQSVGAIHNDGNGGDTTLACDPARWGAQRMADYAAACRRHGQPATQQQVLDALVTECELDQATAAAHAAGGALARLIDTNGSIRELRTITPAPRHLQEVLDLGRTLTRGTDQQWEIWTGAAWFAVPGTVSG